MRVLTVACAVVVLLLPAQGFAQGPARTVYITQAGDTLSGIASRFDTSVAALAQENGIADAGSIRIGQAIVIPTSARALPPTMPRPDTATATGAEPPRPNAGATRLLHTMTLGRSLMGRAIDVRCTGSGARVVLLLGGVHTGYEANSTTLVAALEAAARSGRLAVPAGLWLCFLPALNVDGVALGTHANARGVDLNRNWPTADWEAEAYHPATGSVGGGGAPLSEPETRALYDFLQLSRPELVITWHCCAALVETNGMPLARVLGRQYAAVFGTDYVERWTAYRITGELIRALDAMRIPAIDVEIGWPGDPPVAAHLSAIEALLAALARRPAPPN